MTRVLIAACVGLVVALLIALLRVEAVTGQRDRAVTAAEQSEARAVSLNNTLRLQRELTADAAAIDARNYQELTHVQAENDRLRVAVAAGERRLLVNAICTTVSNASGAGRMDDAGAAELAADARQDYHSLRAELALSRQMILGLQQYVREVCLVEPLQ